MGAMDNISFDGASGHISFLSNITGIGSNAGDLASATLTIRQMQQGQLARLGTVDRPSPNTWRVSLQHAPILPTDLGEPVDASAQGRSYNTLQWHASGHAHQERKVLAQTGYSKSVIKIVVGLSVVLLVCIAFPKRHELGGWARTVVDARSPGEPSQEARCYLRTAHHDEEAVNNLGE